MFYKGTIRIWALGHRVRELEVQCLGFGAWGLRTYGRRHHCSLIFDNNRALV